MTVNIEILGSELHEYVSSSKSITLISDGCKIPNKHGRVEFDFSKFKPDRIMLHAKRNGGNGKIYALGRVLAVNSKTYQSFDIDVNDKIEINRPKDSTGEVVLLGFTFLDNQGEAVGINWKDIISRCGKYSCLRLVKERLFASPGGYIENGNRIQSIETNPHNAFKRDGDIIRFNSSCEITNIILGDGFAANRPADLFTNRNPPTLVNRPDPDVSIDKTKQIDGNAAMRTPKYEHQLPSFDEHILYDSSSVRNFSHFVATNKGVKQVRSNNLAYLVIKQDGQAKASMSVLEANTNYICIINGKKLNGNGRIYIGASIDENFSGTASEAIFSSNFTNKYIQIRTGGGAPNSMQKLHLTMPKSFCNGEVIIQRIMLIRDLGIEHARAGLEGRKYIRNIARPLSPEFSFNFNANVHRKDDSVYVSAKRYALYPHIDEVDHLSSNISGTIMTDNISGVVWASRIRSLIKNIRIGNLKSETVNDSLLISHLGSLKSANRIWIEPFVSNTNISESDALAINCAHKIMSPSPSNVRYLRSKFKDKKIEQAYLPLPWVENRADEIFKNLDFVLVFERDRQGLDQLLRVWNNDLPKLVIVGARGKYPDFVIPLNEYYPYRKLLFLIRKANFIIDLPQNCGYHSSILDLANELGKIIVSTNQFVLDKSNGIFLFKGEEKGAAISDEFMKRAIRQAIDMPKEINNMSNYNEKFLNQVSLLFSL